MTMPATHMPHPPHSGRGKAHVAFPLCVMDTSAPTPSTGARHPAGAQAHCLATPFVSASPGVPLVGETRPVRAALPAPRREAHPTHGHGRWAADEYAMMEYLDW